MRSLSLIDTKKSKITRAVSLLTFFAFTFSCAVTPAQASLFTQSSVSPAESALVKQFTPPSELGTLIDAHVSDSKNSSLPLVIHIQDLHANYSVQTNIAKLLEFLDSKLGAGNYKVAIEGAEGPLTVAQLGKIQDKNFKMKVCDALMKEAELTGTEYFSIVNGKTDVLWGAEDERYHKANIDLFQKTYQGKQEIVKSLAKIETELGPIKEKYYDRTLRKMDEKEADLSAGKISMSSYLHFLARLGEKYGMNIAATYPAVAKQAGLAVADTYTNMDKLQTEKQSLTAELRQRMAKNDIQRNLAQVQGEVSLFKRFMDEQVTTQEVRQLAPKLSEMAGHIKTLLDSVHANYDQKGLSELVSAGLDYYVVALSRDKFLTENALKLSAQNSALKTIVLVAGGFHTPGITKLLKEKGVSYVTLTPNVTEHTARERQLYIARLMERHTDPEEFSITGTQMLSAKLNDGMAGFAGRVFSKFSRSGNNIPASVIDGLVNQTPMPQISIYGKGDLDSSLFAEAGLTRRQQEEVNQRLLRSVSEIDRRLVEGEIARAENEPSVRAILNYWDSYSNISVIFWNKDSKKEQPVEILKNGAGLARATSWLSVDNMEPLRIEAAGVPVYDFRSPVEQFSALSAAPSVEEFMIRLGQSHPGKLHGLMDILSPEGHLELMAIDQFADSFLGAPGAPGTAPDGYSSGTGGDPDFRLKWYVAKAKEAGEEWTRGLSDKDLEVEVFHRFKALVLKEMTAPRNGFPGVKAILINYSSLKWIREQEKKTGQSILEPGTKIVVRREIRINSKDPNYSADPSFTAEDIKALGGSAIKLYLSYSTPGGFQQAVDTAYKEVAEEAVKVDMPLIFEITTPTKETDINKHPHMARVMNIVSAMNQIPKNLLPEVWKLEAPGPVKALTAKAIGALANIPKNEAVYTKDGEVNRALIVETLASAQVFDETPVTEAVEYLTALRLLENAVRATGRPFILLTAGVPDAQFLLQYELVVRFSPELATGMLAGRAVWRPQVRLSDPATYKPEDIKDLNYSQVQDRVVERLRAESAPYMMKLHDITVKHAEGLPLRKVRSMGLRAAPSVVEFLKRLAIYNPGKYHGLKDIVSSDGHLELMAIDQFADSFLGAPGAPGTAADGYSSGTGGDPDFRLKWYVAKAKESGEEWTIGLSDKDLEVEVFHRFKALVLKEMTTSREEFPRVKAILINYSSLKWIREQEKKTGQWIINPDTKIVVRREIRINSKDPNYSSDPSFTAKDIKALGGSAIKLYLSFSTPGGFQEAVDTAYNEVGKEAVDIDMPLIFEITTPTKQTDATPHPHMARVMNIIAAMNFIPKDLLPEVWKLEAPGPVKALTAQAIQALANIPKDKSVYTPQGTVDQAVIAETLQGAGVADAAPVTEAVEYLTALRLLENAVRATGRPFILLTAGVPDAQFLLQYELVVRFSPELATGMLAGRAVWRPQVRLSDPATYKPEDIAALSYSQVQERVIERLRAESAPYMMKLHDITVKHSEGIPFDKVESIKAANRPVVSAAAAVFFAFVTAKIAFALWPLAILAIAYHVWGFDAGMKSVDGWTEMAASHDKLEEAPLALKGEEALHRQIERLPGIGHLLAGTVNFGSSRVARSASSVWNETFGQVLSVGLAPVALLIGLVQLLLLGKTTTAQINANLEAGIVSIGKFRHDALVIAHSLSLATRNALKLRGWTDSEIDRLTAEKGQLAVALSA